MRTRPHGLLLFVLAISFSASLIAQAQLSPTKAWEALKAGNRRYSAGMPRTVSNEAKRRADTATEGQSPFATVIACSDSRVPVERLFDQGVGDIFVIRVAGNVCDTDEVGSIEYGVDHLGTPVMVVLGHSGCGAVTAVATHAELHGSIPQLVDNISPAVDTAQRAYPDLHGKELVPEAVKANVWQSIDDLFKQSPATRKRVAAKSLIVIGAVYHLASGKIEWLGQHPTQSRLLAYKSGPIHKVPSNTFHPAPLVEIASESYELKGVAPETALAELQVGNRRYLTGALENPRRDDLLAALEGKDRSPFATIVTCSDSHIATDRIFDQRTGSTHIVRVEGNVCTNPSIDSIKHGIDYLETPILVVMGHSDCGTIKKLLASAEQPKLLSNLAGKVRPAIETARTAFPELGNDKLLSITIKANVWQSIRDLLQRSPETRARVRAGVLQVVGAVYHLESGQVEWIGKHPSEAALLGLEPLATPLAETDPALVHPAVSAPAQQTTPLLPSVTPKHTPTLDVKHTPTPDVKHTPTPDAKHTPTPDVKHTPTPDAKRTPTPDAKHAPTPDAKHAPTPDAKRTPTPDVKHTPTPDAKHGTTAKQYRATAKQHASTNQRSVASSSPAPTRHKTVHAAPSTFSRTNRHSAPSTTEHSAEPLQLIDPTKLAQLDAARNIHTDYEVQDLTNTADKTTLFTIIFGIATALAFVIAGMWRMGIFSKMSISQRLYSGFSCLIVVCASLTYGSYTLTKSIEHVTATALRLETQGKTLESLQNAFILHGIEDKARGERILVESDKERDRLHSSLEFMHTLGLSDEQAKELQQVEDHLKQYELTFESMTKSCHEIETLKTELEEDGEHLSQELEGMLTRFEIVRKNALASGTGEPGAEIINRLITAAARAEVLELKVAHAEVEFMLDKHIDRIPAMEEGMGKLVALFKTMRELIGTSIADGTEMAAELRVLDDVDMVFEHYRANLSRLILDEMTVAVDQVSTRKHLHAVQSNAEAIAANAQNREGNISHAAFSLELGNLLVIGMLGPLLAFLVARSTKKAIGISVNRLNQCGVQSSASADHLSSASKNVAQGSSEQAASVEEVSSSIHEIDAMLDEGEKSTTAAVEISVDNSQSAAAAQSLTGDALDAVEKGNEVMEVLSAAIESIQKSSNETATIIKTIDDIAFQTNLLALNAAVEAARAGDAGKGFAVVAAEVGSLAQRCTEAASSTTAMIEEAKNQASQGGQVAKQARESLGKIKAIVEDVSGKVTAVAEKSHEQTQLIETLASVASQQRVGVNQISATMTSIADTTQASAASAEETASMTSELKDQAAELVNVVGSLKSLAGLT